MNLGSLASGRLVIAAAIVATATLAAQRAPQRRLSQLVWVDRAGKKLSSVTGLADFGNIELSPDRKQIAAAVLNDQTGMRELWLYDTEGKTRTRLDDNIADENWMIWSPDGKRVAYNSQRTKGLDVYGKDIGSKLENLLAIDEGRGQWPVSWSPDGKNLLVVTNTQDTGNDIWVLPLPSASLRASGRNEKPYPFLSSAAQENWAAFSPNGKWVAFSFAEQGEETELFVTTFPKAGRRYLVSSRGGFQARWRRDGRELFFLATNGTLTTSLMAAEVDSDAKEFEVKDVKKLFDVSVPYPPYHAFDVSNDGQRILIDSALLGPGATSARLGP